MLKCSVGIISGEVRNNDSHVIGYNHPKEHIEQEKKEIKVKKNLEEHLHLEGQRKREGREDRI